MPGRAEAEQEARPSTGEPCPGSHSVLSSIHAVEAREQDLQRWERLLVSGGGATGVHEHSAVILDGTLVIAVGDSIVALQLATGAALWSRKGDDATVFGVHPTSRRDGLIVHGELAVSRWTIDGIRLWERSGRDIFTGALKVTAAGIEVFDFEGRSYLFPESGA